MEEIFETLKPWGSDGSCRAYGNGGLSELLAL